MNWITKWRAISAHILSLGEAGNYLLQAFQANDGNYGGVNLVLRELEQIGRELQAFFNEYASQLPPFAAEYLRDRLEQYQALTHGLDQAPSSGRIQGVAAVLMIRAHFEFLIHDTEIEGRNATELAFEHLRRLIVVNAKIREEWAEAFKQREERSESLGAVHLLSHGIWAFKVTGSGAATDLVYREPLVQSPILQRTARALVLTEWKKATDDSTARAQSESAVAQARLYAGGVLGDIELKRTRYIIIVSPHLLGTLPDVERDGITYRHVMISLSQEQPSVEARRRKDKR
jgi:hypothetical protein